MNPGVFRKSPFRKLLIPIGIHPTIKEGRHSNVGAYPNDYRIPPMLVFQKCLEISSQARLGKIILH
jgi:hypothetical protein